MIDLIDRKAAIDAVNNERCEHGMIKDILCDKILISAKDRIRRLPPAQPERKTGKWDFIGDNMFACSGCGTPYTLRQLSNLKVRTADSDFPKFCPNCGTDMRGEQDEID